MIGVYVPRHARTVAVDPWEHTDPDIFAGWQVSAAGGRVEELAATVVVPRDVVFGAKGRRAC